MSRFGGDDWDGEGVHPLMWEQTCRNALAGRRGQAVLRELKAALLALPEPRLIDGAFAEPGAVCALGALAAHRLERGHPFQYLGSVVRSLDDLIAREDLEDDWVTLNIGEAMGLKRALAWAIGYENDEGSWSRETPEQRWSRMLRWVEGQIREGGREHVGEYVAGPAGAPTGREAP